MSPPIILDIKNNYLKSKQDMNYGGFQKMNQN